MAMWLSKRVVQIVMLVCIVVPCAAFAHATPISYTPLAGSTELTTPASISIRFTERIEVGASSLSVYGPDSSLVNTSKGSVDAEDNRIISVPISEGGEGVYTVSWQVVSVDDGHFTKGAYSFMVDPTGKVYEGYKGGVDVSYSSKLPDAYLGFVQLIGESIFLGVLGFLSLALLLSSRKKLMEKGDEPDAAGILFKLVIFGGLLFIAGALMAFFRKSAELAALQGTPLIDALLVYVQSSVGTFSALKLICAVIFMLLCILFRKNLLRMPIAAVWGLFLLLFLILAMQSYVSHAAASFFYPVTSVFITFVHLISKELIVGGLFVLMAIAVVFINSRPRFLMRCVRYYDLFASCALLCAVVSGAYITWLHLKSGSNLVHTQWGELFILLLLCTAVLGVARVFHQLIVSPRLDTDTRLYRSFLITLGVEVGLACFVLFFSGYIAITTPPFTVEAYTYTEVAENDGITTQLRVHPYEVGSMLVEFTQHDQKDPVTPKAVIITAENAYADIGPNVLSVEKRFEGGYVFPLNELNPAGEWKLQITAQREEGYDVNAAFTIEYPSAIEAAKHTDDVRRFDDFAVIVLSVGSAGTLIALFLIIAALHAVRFKRENVTVGVAPVSISQSLFIGSIGIGVIGVVLATGWSFFGESDLKKMCEADGHQFVQAFPTRDFEATSPNAQNGCLVHDGHFHFIDEREYATWKKEWK